MLIKYNFIDLDCACLVNKYTVTVFPQSDAAATIYMYFIN